VGAGNGHLFVGDFGVGTFNHTAGIVNVGGQLIVGRSATGQGTYNLSGTGVLNAASETVGGFSAGRFTQTGGTHIVSGALTIGANTGLYNHNGGTLSAATINLPAGAIFNDNSFGRLLYGTFNHSGGVFNATAFNTIDPLNLSAGGTYNLVDGTFSALNSVALGMTGPGGTIVQTGGTFNTAGYLIVGHSSTGSFVQNAGENRISINDPGDASDEGLSIGYEATGVGTYTLNGGRLNVPGISFGGALVVGRLGHGTLNINGGTLDIGSNATIGSGSTSVGTVNQSGGIVTISNPTASFGMFIGRDPGSTGYYRIANATLTIHGNLQVGFGGNGTFVHDSGAVNILSNFANNGLIFIANDPGSHASYTMNGGTLTIDTTSGMYVGGDTAQGGHGTLTVNSGALISITSGVFKVWPTGVLNLNGGTILLAGQQLRRDPIPPTINGITNLGGGKLQTEIVLNTGSFNQSGGIYSGTMINQGTYNFSGGNLAGANITIAAADPFGPESTAGVFNWTSSNLNFGSSSAINLQGEMNITSAGNLTNDTAETGTVILAGLLRKPSSGGSIGTNTFSANVNVRSEGATVDVQVGAIDIQGPLIASAGTTLTKTGVGTLALSGAQNWGTSSQLVVDGGAVVLNSRIGDAADPQLAINGSSVIVSPGGDKTTVFSALSINTVSGKLDLNDNDLVINYDGVSPLPTVRQYLQLGRAGGAWNGNGIATSLGNATTRTLGVAEASSLNITSFSGETVDATSVLVKYTYYGDADLDGDVDVADLGRLASNWQSLGSWIAGDFDYSGSIDVNDLGLLASNWQAGVGNPLRPSFSEAAAGLGLPDVSVPEPAGVGLALALVLNYPHRARRRSLPPKLR
jgi:hypothetical protein